MKEYIEREAAVKEYCLDMCGHEYEADLCGKCNYPLRNVPSADGLIDASKLIAHLKKADEEKVWEAIEEYLKGAVNDN